MKRAAKGLGMRHPKFTVRCPNCLSKIPVEKGSLLTVCEKCGIKYRICWPTPSQPMIRGLAAPLKQEEKRSHAKADGK